jgi:hypothetical protein
MANRADPDLHGNKPYQQVARRVLPILVRQVNAEEPIQYDRLAQEVGMSNPRNLNYPLDCIGQALSELRPPGGVQEIPDIQALVVNKQTHLPGPGFDEFLTARGHKWGTRAERRAIIEEYWSKIYAYPYWADVLQALGLRPTATNLAETIEKAGRMGGGGEGPEHLALKEFVARNPMLFGLAYNDLGEAEHCLPSGDSIDVLFSTRRRLLAVEVKPTSSPKEDITRGLFQCVKYRALVEARARFEHDRRDIAAYLVLGGRLPSELIPLRNSLNVEVIDNVRVTAARS